MTPGDVVSAVLSRSPAALGVLLFRSLPFAAWALVSRRARPAARLAPAAAVLALLLGAWRWRPGLVHDLAPVPGLFAYFALCALGIHALCRWAPRSVLRGGAALVAGCLLFVALPALFVRTPGVAPMVIFGWEAALSAHSYAVDGLRARPSWRDALSFLLVHPTLVFAERPSQTSPLGADWRGGARVVLGTVTLVGRDAMLLAVAQVPWLRPRDLDAVTGPAGYAAFVLSQLPLLLGLYCAHSGLASIQIGWMRVLGFRLPERYRYPLLAVTPRDFWERWNAWIGRWVHLYLYRPVGRALYRRLPMRPAASLAALASFVACGLLHDVGAWGLRATSGRTSFTVSFTVLFFVIGVVYAVWQLVERRGASRPRATPVLARAAAWVAMMHLVCVVAWLAVPVLRGGHLPPSVRRTATAARERIMRTLREDSSRSASD